MIQLRVILLQHDSTKKGMEYLVIWGFTGMLVGHQEPPNGGFKMFKTSNVGFKLMNHGLNNDNIGI